MLAWSEPLRRYHDLRHLGECLALWARWHDVAEHPEEVALALWYHDAVYDTEASDNERRSADWATKDLGRAGVDANTILRIQQMVLATCYDSPAETPDAKLLVDIDLAILGSPPRRFKASSQTIREEYARVPEVRYRRGRAKVLRALLEREPPYNKQAARDAFEVQAKSNLKAEIACWNPTELEFRDHQDALGDDRQPSARD